MRKSIAGIILLLVFSSTIPAATLVLLHGYLSDEDTGAGQGRPWRGAMPA